MKKFIRERALIVLGASVVLIVVLFLIWLSNRGISTRKAPAPFGPVGIELEKSISIIVAHDATTMSCRMLSKQIITAICEGFSMPLKELADDAMREGWVFRRDTVSPIYFKGAYYSRGSDALIVEWDNNEIVRSVAIIRNF
ncbi:hypothetical protein [Variovorax fucosicus]|uniref:hypothetical protein n=1 Tax=Variovorax fucosicus TaxID=3053517 RepID=UPI0025783266|nr:hypothetical protein [Variovorax sp. J22G47]MDM0059523.1 hypothetical protein [Variovorax sp. J22G47]